MSRLLPFKSETAPSPDDPQVLDLGDEATEEALSALSSETARKILAAVYDEPKTPPEIRDEVGTSLQNVHYHVDNLEEADLIEPAGTGYSEKGTEMTVYAPANEAVVLFAGREHDRSRLQTALTRLLGAVGLLAVASLVVRRLVETMGGDPTDVGPLGPDDGAGPAATGTPDPATEPPTAAPSPAADTPGIAVETPTPVATDAPARTPAPSPTPAGTPPPSATPAETPPPQGTPTAGASPTPDPLGTPTATPRQTPAPTGTPTEQPVATGAETPTPTETPVPSDPTTAMGDVPGTVDSLLADPGVAFFLGGVFMLGVAATWWYLSA